jgi:hypothetical protein
VLEKEKIRKLADEREKKVRTRYGRLVDAYHKRTDHRQSIIDRRNEKDSTFGKIQEDRDNYTSMLKFSTALKLQDKVLTHSPTHSPTYLLIHLRLRM